MKKLVSIFAFLVFFIPASGAGVWFAIDAWQSDPLAKDPSTHPSKAVRVAVIFTCVGILTGSYSARLISRRYDHKNTPHG
jgi:hypothetical protein